MTTKNNKKKNNSARKIIPAAGMLMVSALMLSTSTYAWFTMSREVEVKNIQMTATVPEDIQISLGHLVDFTTAGDGDAKVSNASTFTGLAGNQGILKKATNGDDDTADDGNVLAPYNGNDAVSALDWSSSADISEYYRLGKIIPASSIDGQNIYFTPDAAGVGKTLKAGAKYYQAANISGAFKWKADTTTPANSTYATDGGGDSAKTTLHAINNVTETSDKWNTGEDGDGYLTATEWNVTRDDGYFVDIPIWFRSSAQSELTLAVDAYVTTKQAKDDDDLYLAARAAILWNDTKDTAADNKDGYTSAPATEDTSGLLRIRKDNFSGTSIVNYMYSTNSTGDAVNGTNGTYGNAVEYTGAPYVKVAAGANNGYGPMTKAIIRVWLEGEDPNCWNSNAGQDFAISLKFTKDDLSSSGLNTYPVSKITDDAEGTKVAADQANSLKAGARVMVTSTSTPAGASTANVDVLEFEFNGSKWSLVTDGSFHKYEGLTYKIDGYNTEIKTSDDIADYLYATVTTKEIADAHNTQGTAYVVTGAVPTP